MGLAGKKKEETHKGRKHTAECNSSCQPLPVVVPLQAASWLISQAAASLSGLLPPAADILMHARSSRFALAVERCLCGIVPRSSWFYESANVGDAAAVWYARSLHVPGVSHGLGCEAGV